jgi:hypothetical protein
MAQKPTAKHAPATDPEMTQLLQSYEAGLRAMQEHKYDKAKTMLSDQSWRLRERPRAS